MAGGVAAALLREKKRPDQLKVTRLKLNRLSKTRARPVLAAPTVAAASTYTAVLAKLLDAWTASAAWPDSICDDDGGTLCL